MKKIIFNTLILTSLAFPAFAAVDKEANEIDKALAKARGENNKYSKDEALRVLDDVAKQYPHLIFIKAGEIRDELIEKERQEAEENVKKNKNKYEDLTGIPSFGTGETIVTMFSDYRCGYCRKGLDILEKVKSSDGGIKIVSRDLPILGPISDYSARASIAFYKLNPDKWWEFHKVLQRSAPSTEKQVIAIAEKLEVSGGKLKDEMKEPYVEEIIKKNRELANIAGITGTPGFVIGTIVIPGAVPEEEFQKAIKTARKK